MSWLTDPDEEWSGGSEATPENAAQPPAAQPRTTPPPAGYQPGGYQPTGYQPGTPPPYQPSGYEPGSAGPDYRQPQYQPGYEDPTLASGYQRSGYHAFADDLEDEPRSRLPVIAAIVGAWLVVSLLVLGFLLVVHGPHKSNTGATAPKSGAASSSAPGSSASNGSSSANPNLPTGWTQQAADDQTDCAGHSYGRVAAFLAKTPCSSLHRALITTQSSNRTVVIASYVITFTNSGKANLFDKLVSADGTGNVNDLLREGTTFTNAPAHISDNAAFAAQRNDKQVSVAEAAYTSGTTNNNDAALQALAQQAVATG
ncbi:DUF3824 domain-containing protein [Jatrophihabitans telluris]|uniref:DUF3824 domain-containing protein n=1 Tax=Jatrophihabitans telluris TaxID=2038343 RepID=A0ABY4QYM0_9ACTN|nr:DUF3824 domain-containing protein [Jatrophihabitans telluris]UQX88728.1 DUF3824 domain-containing protein [Jatrophihabitans telluris]